MDLKDDETRYLTLFGTEKDDAIYDRIRYLISLKGGITYPTNLQKSKLILLILVL